MNEQAIYSFFEIAADNSKWQVLEEIDNRLVSFNGIIANKQLHVQCRNLVHFTRNKTIILNEKQFF